MTRLALVDNTCAAKSAYLQTRELPAFYMEDYSILGFAVNGYGQARDILKASGYLVTDKEGGGDIFLENSDQVRFIATILQDHGIHAELTDIADTIYQA